jgi:hypothetical protein
MKNFRNRGRAVADGTLIAKGHGDAMYSKSLGFKHGVDSVLYENASSGPQGAG